MRAFFVDNGAGRSRSCADTDTRCKRIGLVQFKIIRAHQDAVRNRRPRFG